MKKKYLVFIGLSLFTKLNQPFAQDLKHLASYETGTADASEVVAYDKTTKKAVFITTSNNSFSIVDINDPKNPVLVSEIALSGYGGGPNSIAIYNSIIAIAVEATVKTDNGKVIFFDINGNFLKEVNAGALPDMLTFTPDGKKVIVANEGEPSDDYTVDPNGSISIIDITSGVANATVNNIDFTGFDSKKEYLKNKGVRMFGNNGLASVSQDIEPEYITITNDGSKAYVICQENNAFALI